MPEIKHTFTAGKMNKDLDLRHVPQGEYRDAMNIQVRTTDASAGGSDGDAGTVQNIIGNDRTKGSIPTGSVESGLFNYNGETGPLGKKQVTVAMIADEKSDRVYSLISAPEIPSVAASGLNNPGFGSRVSVFIDAIIEYDIKLSQMTPVLIDKFCVVLSFVTDLEFNTSGWFVIPKVNFNGDATLFDNSHIRVGMTMEAFDANGNEIGLQDAVVGQITNAAIILNKEQYVDLQQASRFVFKSKRVLNFHGKNTITGINIINDLLFWTDNTNEPKKINITRCKAGNPFVGSYSEWFTTHTQLKLKNPNDSDDFIDAVNATPGQAAEPSSGTDVTNDIREEHITVMRQAPNTAPTIKMSSSERDLQTSFGSYEHDFSIYGNLIVSGLEIQLPFDVQDVEGIDWRVGDRIILTNNVTDDEIKIIATINSIGTYVENSEQIAYTIDVTAAFNDGLMFGPLTWDIRLEEKKPIFETKLCRFGYRYKYEDGEYSSFSPFSEIAFLPGEFDYEPRKGYNLGMVNTVRQLTIKDFIPHVSTRQVDACAIDILYKTTDSPVVYVVETVTRNKSNEWDLFTYSSVNPQWEFGRLEITSEMIHKALPSNQILRAWDYVPRQALAQEIVGNRLVYANYKQGYDINTIVNLETSLITKPTPTIESPLKSLKSIRKYKFGMVFGDKYGRETPVVSSTQLDGTSFQNYITSTGDIDVPKKLAKNQNLIKLKQTWENPISTGQPEEWMEYVKYYVKETTNEYYNLVLDRWYFGEDGNIWLSFQSADRNKVDEQTYLLLKNEHGTNVQVEEKARYKIIAIDNEAPDFIKLDQRILGAMHLTEASFESIFEDPDDATFNVNEIAPTVLSNSTEIKITSDFKGFFKNYEKKGTLKVRVVGRTLNTSGETINTLSGSYKTVTHFKDESPGDDGTIYIQEEFGSEANMLNKFVALDYPLGASAVLNYYLEFKEEVVLNRPEFDGKFFCKVERDSVLEDRVLGYNNDTISYDTFKIYPIAYIDTQLVNPGLRNVTEDGVTIGAKSQSIQVDPYDYSEYVFMNAKTSGTIVSDGIVNYSTKFRSPVTTDDIYTTVVGWSGDSSSEYSTGGFTDSRFFDPDITTNQAERGVFQEDDDGVFDGNLPRVAKFALGCSTNNNNWGDCTETTTVDSIFDGGFMFKNSDAYDWDSDDTYENDLGFNGKAIINYGHHTQAFWNTWRIDSNEDNACNRLFGGKQHECIFIDGARSARLKWNAFSFNNNAPDWNNAGVDTAGWNLNTGSEGVYVNLNQDLAANGNVNGNSYSRLVKSDFYKNTAFMEGYADDDDVGQTAMDEFGRVSFSIIGKNTSTFKSSGNRIAGFYEFFTTPGNYFSFEDDPYENTYKIIGTEENGGFQEDLNNRNFFSGNGGPYPENGSHYDPNNNGNNAKRGVPWQDESTYNLSGSAPLLIGKYYGNKSCGSGFEKCTDGLNELSGRNVKCSIRIEFRLVNKLTGALENFGTKGLDPNVWDPRSKLTHDGRTVLQLNLKKRVDTSGEFNKSTTLNACFETEPKEDIGLDLYYEASNSIPMNLDSSNTLDFAPLKSKVTCKRGEQGSLTNVSFGSTSTNHHLAHVGYTSTNPVVLIKSTINGINSAHTTDIVIGDYIVFTHTDGTETMAKVTNLMQPLIEGASPFPNPSVNFVFPFVTSEYDTIESNIYAIGLTYSGYNWFQNGVDTEKPIMEVYSNPSDLQLEEGMFVSVLGFTPEIGETLQIQSFVGEINGNQVVVLNNDSWINTDPVSQQAYQKYKASITVTENNGFYEIEPEVWKNEITLAWHNCWSFGNGVESDRIRDDFNAPQIDNGVIVSTVSEDYGEQHLSNRFIYSGIYNSTSGVNELNEFNISEKITKDINPSYGSIQRLKTRNTDVVAFCEDKVLKVIANKDAVFNADGKPQLIATNRVLGTATPFSGDYGISKNPESLAVDQYRMYFTDKQRGAVLRLSGDGLTPISNVGMKSFFRKKLIRQSTGDDTGDASLSSNLHEKLIGSFDIVTGEYNLTQNFYDVDNVNNMTVSFNEGSKGWVSFKSFMQQAGVSCSGGYYTGEQQNIWMHYKNPKRNNFYGVQYESSIDVVFNDQPSSMKSFYSINYEGSKSRIVKDIINDNTVSFPAIASNTNSILDANNDLITSVKSSGFYNLSGVKGWYVESFETDMQSGYVPEFINKENKWYNKICGVPTTILNIDTSEFSFQGLGIPSSVVFNTGEDSDGNANLNVQLD
tara:strand:- start:18496 stop:25170 length:6675 start_codon:yes stop_codon:yes gene_type:complete